MPLKSIQHGLHWLCVFPFDKNTNTTKKMVYIFFISSIFFLHLCALAASAVFIFKFISIDMQRSVFALLQFGTFFSTTYSIIVAFFIREQIIGIFKKISEIYRASKTLLESNMVNEIDLKTLKLFQMTKMNLFKY